MAQPFAVGISTGFLLGDGRSLLDRRAQARMEEHGLIVGRFGASAGEVQAEAIGAYDGIVLLGERFGERALAGNTRLVGVARWGVGYDMVDLAACTAADVCVFITPNGVRRPVALASLTFLLALAMKIRPKDALVRSGEWARKTEYMGDMLAGKVLGSLGLGNIGRDLFRLAAPLEMRHLACDPYVGADQAAALGVQLVDKATLLREADYLCINTPLTPETYHAIGTGELALMKPTAYLINTARGPIVDEAALIAALRDGRLRGAGLDVFEREPLPPDSPLLGLENVWLAPHALGWTEQLVLGNSLEDAEGLISLARGEVPPAVVNRAVLDRPGFHAKLRALRERSQG